MIHLMRTKRSLMVCHDLSENNSKDACDDHHEKEDPHERLERDRKRDNQHAELWNQMQKTSHTKYAGNSEHPQQTYSTVASAVVNSLVKIKTCLQALQYNQREIEQVCGSLHSTEKAAA